MARIIHGTMTNTAKNREKKSKRIQDTCWKLLIFILVPFRKIFNFAPADVLVPAISKTRLLNNETMSSSRKSILNRSKSGLKVTQVKSLPLYFLISGSDLSLMLFRNTCLNFRPRVASDVSIINSEEKILASFAP
jgi:hypothetical protein